MIQAKPPPLSAEVLRASLSNAVLRLILMPTEACNLRCTYCYETFSHGRMRPEVVQGVKRFVERRAADLEHLTLSWFGGEPLLALDIVQDILTHAHGVLDAHPRIRLRSDMTTNAYHLTRSTFERLVALGVRDYQITLDGARSRHDRRRRRPDGGGTFERIWSQLVAMRQVQEDFEVLIRLHVDADDPSAMQEFIDEIASTFAGDVRFKLFVRHVSPFGGPNDATYPFLEPARGVAVIAALRRYAAAAGLRTVTAEEIPRVCYATQGNSLIVRADGRLAKCTVALEHPANVVGRIHDDGLLDLQPEKMRIWMRGLWSQDPTELRCPMIGFAEPRQSQSAGAAVQAD